MPMPNQEIPQEETQIGKAERSAMTIRPALRSAPPIRFKEVETVKIFATSGHPWIAFASLLVWRLPLGALTLATIVYVQHRL